MKAAVVQDVTHAGGRNAGSPASSVEPKTNSSGSLQAGEELRDELWRSPHATGFPGAGTDTPASRARTAS